MSKHWTKRELKYLKENYYKVPVKNISKILKRNENSIKWEASKLKLKSHYNLNRFGENNPMWGKTQTLKTKRLISIRTTKFNLSKNQLKNLYYNQNLSTAQIGKLYNVNAETVRNKMKRFRLDRREPSHANDRKKFTKEHRENMSRTRIKRRLSMEDKNPMAIEKNIKKWFKSSQIQPNKPETMLINLFKQNNLSLHYVGDGKLIVGGKCPDFVCNPSKKVVLLHGDYWHYLKQKKENPLLTRQQVEEKDIAHYKKNFFDCLIVWEHELKNPNQVLIKIKGFIK